MSLTATAPILFGDLKRQHDSLATELTGAMERVRASGWFILGAEVAAFEREWAAYCGARHAVGVASGTDAIQIALEALGVGPGDEVITTPHTAVPTVHAISFTGARPVFVDVEWASMNLDPAGLETAITPRTRAILPVHLYGQPADMTRIGEIAARHRIPVVEDAAQGHGARWQGRPAGTLGRLTAFSFYPTKNLGAMGDAGAVVTDDDELVEWVRVRRNLGQRERARYLHTVVARNSRLDELQAAILRAKLPHLDGWIERRRAVAAAYTAGIDNPHVETPREVPGAHHTYHLYAVRSPHRDALQAHLKAHGIATIVHYPIPVHLQDAYRDLGLGPGSFPNAERCAREVLSLPLYPELRDDEVARVIEAVNAFRPDA